MRQFILPVVLLFIQFSIQAQELQPPSAFFGYELGTQFSRQSQVVDYFEQVQKATPQQVKLQYYGKTNERRPLLLAFVSSEENLKNLEQIRENNLKQAGVVEGNSEANDIAIVWLSYNVHGNEASSTEAAMNTIYKLLTEKQEWLKNTVVIIDPCLNPDGRDRYVNWYNETASLPYDKDQQASEHQEPWPGGRPNHYLFDLNRDWVWATQVETQARLKVYNQWLPQIHVDFHEQGIEEPYYFAPAAAPFHEIISDWQRDFQTEIGKNNAKYFDQNGWLYFTRERFDLLYPSYGDTYPTYMGAIGMTYEQAGHGRAGLGIMTDEGEELTLIDRLKHHTTSGLSTVEMASKNAAKLNLEFAKFFDNSALQTKSYVLQGNADKIERLTQLLDKHAISYGFAQGGSVSGYDYASNNEGKRSTDSEYLVVSTNQPKGKMVKVLFEAQTKLVDSLTYDITAWSIPFAYGLDALASKSLIPTSTLGKSPQLNTVSNNATGYIFKWNSLQDAQFLAELLKANIRVRFTEKPMDTQGAVYNRGSLIVIRGDNKTLADFDAQLLQISNKHQRRLIGINSGFSTSAPDFGSPDVKLVHPPKIALLSGDYTYSLNYGEIWYFFEQELQYPVTTINTKYVSRSDLSKYDILIMPNGNYSELLNDKLLADLKDWIRAGGKLIAIDAAMRSFVDKEGFGLSLNKQEADSSKVVKKSKLIPYADREREAIKNSITGAIFKTKVDSTHPMAFGYGDDYFSLKLGADSYQLLESGYNVAYLGEDPKSVAGFVGNEAAKKLDNSLVFGEQPMGQGSVIYMVDNVLFRNFWDNGKLFFVNALFYVGAE